MRCASSLGCGRGCVPESAGQAASGALLEWAGAERGTMDKIAVCAIFKDEAPYLLEWIAFHKMIGVDLFVLYDNGSTDGGPELIRRSNFARNVTLIEWSDRPGQISAYRHFHEHHARDFTWAAFIDLDEFIMPASGGSIRDILIRKVYEPYADILLNWLIFGPSGHDRRPGGSVIENFTWRIPWTMISPPNR